MIYIFRRIEIAKLELKPGDVLAVGISGQPSEAERERVRQFIEKKIPNIEIIVYNRDAVDFSIIAGGENKPERT